MRQRLLFTALLLLFANIPIRKDVLYNFDADTNFGKFKTYKWVQIKDADKVIDVKNKEIQNALDAQLAKKHLTKTDADSADLYIGYQAGGSAERQFASYTDWGYGPGWYREGWYSGYYDQAMGQTSTLYFGQLAVDIYDSKRHYLVWRGVVSLIKARAEPLKQEKNLKEVMDKLFKHYPPSYLYASPAQMR
jgi:uncharacterized protein DUF4136